MRVRRLAVPAALLVALALPATGVAHLLDHAVPAANTATPPNPAFQSGGPNAKWESLGTIPTGNPHTDLDFFKQKGETYASVGTLGTGANGGGQTIVKLTEGGAVVRPSSGTSSHPSAACASNPSAILGLQHDVEATPKGGTILNTPNALAAPGEAQLLIDTTDAAGRCHDQGTLGVSGAPRGGLELIDIAEDVSKPKEIGLTTHVGESHTFNVDPKRPQIAFSITSDTIGVNTDGKRANDTTGSALDGFEVVDLASCMNFMPGTSLMQKREQCRPQVYRYRYPSGVFAQGHQAKADPSAASAINGCHESEIYPDDRLSCAAGPATILFDLKGAFDDNGTPDVYTDDKPRGTPLPCNVRPSSTASTTFDTDAMITDCVNGEGADGKPVDLRVSNWMKLDPRPELEGVKHIGTAYHQGRGAGGTASSTFKADEDVDFSHEAELTGSGRFLLATDERGGGVTPPGAACDANDVNKEGNGGVHFYAVDRLRKEPTSDAEEAFRSYARTEAGKKAIYRVPIRTGAQATICTSHVLQQIPGQNRIFMAWYSQGTQVFDFVENEDGTLTFKEAGYFIPVGANQWSSAVFKMDKNADGTFTYFGAAGDFNLGEGRSSIELYKVTLPAPPTPRVTPAAVPAAMGTPAQGGVAAPTPNPNGTPISGPATCQAAAGLRSISATRSGGGLRFAFRGDGTRADVDVFQVSSGNRVLTERLVARFPNRTTGFRWNGRNTRTKRALGNGDYIVRYRLRGSRGGSASLRLTVRRSRGRFSSQPGFERRGSCATLERFKLERPVFGGRGKTPLRVAVKLSRMATVSLEVRRGDKIVKRVAGSTVTSARTARIRISPDGLAKGRYDVRVVVREGARTETATLSARRL